ncbi:peptidoglycan DD-metalloendopeptidase family protein [Thauera mechernichensis]|uniref:Peptidoglycan DD-metalloendopeptidase family protein n=1 Tax=Thauera mechernichensis TaxID=82788 RepID=A0ABW3WK36_9RHOO|nr:MULTISPECIES: M23 family metallopeptidase [Thauera]HNR60427.1 M23 family metallopeptidase [Thauera sp.]ENO81675.1 peptidase M23 [Thauera sp. 27]MDG3063193.1 M23 family metallopeptidase [Thauera mechernichensis]WBL63235.1 M23 family metallopeptidase [Thauera sp. WB-2]HNS92964.1 M23 family metallopeptidase [Thauera sp.]
MKARKTRILADLPAQLLLRPRSWLLAGITGASLLGVVAATAVAPGSDTADIQFARVVESLPAPVAVIEAENDLPFVYSERIQAGDTLQSIFSRLHIDDAEALAHLSASAEGKQAVRQLRAGRSVTAIVSPDGRIASFSVPMGNSGTQLVLERNDQGLALRESSGETQVTMTEMRSGTITHSLFGATDAVGLPDNVATQLATIFGTWIDFHTDLRKGDRFNVIYEAIYEEGNPVRAGRIVAAEFINKGERHAVVLHRGPSGKEQYYSDDGRSLQQGFLRSPLEFSRVSSSFGRRLHPIHRSWRNHNGTDFAAPTGTPIKATSDGTVEFVGSQRGFGNLIVLKHRNGITTHYAHLNGFAKGLSKGQPISQGDLIGYVGCTGWCTGPHLHYEVHINKVPQDPMTVALPMADTLNARELAAFKRDTAPLRNRFALLNYELASAE